MAFVLDKETYTITDHERGIVLLSKGGYPSGHKDWIIKWGDETIGFMAKDKWIYGGERGNTPLGIEWFVSSMDLPASLQEKKSEIMLIIQEALDASWKSMWSEGGATVTFEPRYFP